MNPVIVRVLMLENWTAAAGVVFAETLSAAAGMMGVPTGGGITVDFAASLPDWPSRRSACARMGVRCAESDQPDLACVWALLAADPTNSDPAAKRAFVPPFHAIADAIVHDPALLEDLAFIRRVMALRWLVDFGSKSDDVIAAARELGDSLDVLAQDLEAWALKWSGSGK